MDDLTYTYYLNDIMNNKNKPYAFANKTMAKTVYEKLKERHIDATIYDCTGYDYICITEKARRKLLKNVAEVVKAIEAGWSLYESVAEAIQMDLDTEI